MLRVVTYCFLTTCWLAHNQLSWNVLLFCCNLIGQLCLSGPGYSSCTVNIHWKFFVRRYCGPNQWLDQHVISRVFSLAYFRARSIKVLTFSFAEKWLLISQQISSLSACLIHVQEKWNEIVEIVKYFLVQDGLGKSTPALVGPHHCFRLITESVLIFHVIVCFPAWRNKIKNKKIPSYISLLLSVLFVTQRWSCIIER